MNSDANGNAVGNWQLLAPGTASTLAVGATASGVLELFATDPFHNQVYRLLINANGTANGSFTLVPSGQGFDLGFTSTSATVGANGNATLFALGTNGQAFELTFDNTGAPIGTFTKLGPLTNGTFQTIVIGPAMLGEPSLFGIGTSTFNLFQIT